MGRKKNKESEGFQLGPTIKKGLIALLLVTLGILIILAFLGLAGDIGDFADTYLSQGIGLIRYVLPFILFFLAIKSDPIDFGNEEEDKEESTFEKAHPYAYILGAILFTLGIAGLLHLILEPTGTLEQAGAGAGGGYAGYYLTLHAKLYFGLIASSVIFTAVFLASLVLMFNSSFFALFIPHKANNGPFSKLILRFQKHTDTDEDYEDDEYDDYETEEEYDEDEIEEERGTFFRRILSFTNNKSTLEEDGEDDQEEDFEEEDEVEEKIKTTSKSKSKKKVKKESVPQPNNPAKPYNYPPLSLLKISKATAKAGDIKRNSDIIRRSLDNFGIKVEMGDAKVGPTVTQYTFKPAEGIKLNKITSLSNDLALALAAHPIRIEAPIPGESLVGIEVPNQRTALVTLLDLLQHNDFSSQKNNYHIALGKDVGGKPIYAHLPSMPHMLIAGATGSGKTVCVNTVLLSLIFQHSPQELKFIMVDPKRVELPLYNGIPHLLTPVITDTQKTVNALKWCIGEMERRFDLLAKTKKREIASYNSAMKKKGEEGLPIIVFVIDELADLMLTAGNEVEAGIMRIAQMARAVGIHLIVATQRPSVDVITGVLKANIPSRIAFSVASITDSRTILDSSGAEKLVGKGDMLFTNAALSSPKRIQGAFISEEEMKKVIDFIKHDDVPVYDDHITQRQQQTTIFANQSSDDETEDVLYEDAKETVIKAGKASASYLQRKLKVGYARAARLLDMLEENRVIGPAKGSKPREILITSKEDDTIDDSEIDNDEDENYDSLT